MARNLTLKCERGVENAAEEIRLWANDMTDDLYGGNARRHPLWWADYLDRLATEYRTAAEAYDRAPKSGPPAAIAG